MNSWPVNDAKARFNELLDKCMNEGPQMVTRCGVEAAVLLPASEWRRLHPVDHPTLKQLLLSDEARTERLTAPRGKARRRAPTPLP